ncbi:Kelch-like protein 10, partial [Schistosoma japonicum]
KLISSLNSSTKYFFSIKHILLISIYLTIIHTSLTMRRHSVTNTKQIKNDKSTSSSSSSSSALNQQLNSSSKQRYSNKRTHHHHHHNDKYLLQSIHNDLDYLCDRNVEFLESGLIYPIITIEFIEHSEYFQCLLKYHKHNENIHLPEFLQSTFYSIIQYIHYGNINININNIYSLYIATDYLLMPKLHNECMQQLKKQLINKTINYSIIINLWFNCQLFYYPKLYKIINEIFLQNFELLQNAIDYKKFTFKQILQILHDDKLNCQYEFNVFNVVLQWIHVNIKQYNQYTLIQLLCCIRLGMLTMNELEQIKQHELIQMIPEYKNILNEWPKCLLLTNNSIINVYGQEFITPRLPHEVIIVFGGWCNGEGPKAAVQVYNPKTNLWTLWTEEGRQIQTSSNELMSLLQNSQVNHKQLFNVTDNCKSSLPLDEFSSDRSTSDLSTDNTIKSKQSSSLIGKIPKRVYAGCVLVGTCIYIIGGFDGNQALKSTMCYNLEEDSGWYEISCMYEKRYYVSVANINETIYAMGGHNGEIQGRLNSAEKYDIHENLWQTIASMNYKRSDASAIEFYGKIYIVGGFDGRFYHDSGEYYEPITNQWTLISRMNSPRGGVSLIQHHNYLYAIGGNNGNNRLKTIEQYNVIHDNWKIIGEMKRCKSNASCTIINDVIYIIGGWSDEQEIGILDLVECYNVIKHECYIVQSLVFPASATCACTLKGCDLVRKYI